MEVAVTEFPVRIGVAGDRLHLHVGGEEIVAAVGAVFGNLFEEEAGVDALPKELALVVGEAHDDGVDRVGRHGFGQRFDGQHSNWFGHGEPFQRRESREH